jgi:hypothetical protein
VREKKGLYSGAASSGVIRRPFFHCLFLLFYRFISFFSFLGNAAHTMGGFNSSRERKYLMVVSEEGA